MATTRSAPARTPAVPHASDFRRVWLGATVSALGDAASWVALVALAVSMPGASVAALAVCYTAPVAVGGLAAGWALDRFDRRRLLIADSCLRAGVFAIVPVAAGLGGLRPGLLYGVAAGYGLLKMVSLAGFPALIPQLVAESGLDRANAMEGASYGLASFAGAGLGGLAIGAFGPDAAVTLIAIDVITYLVFAIALAGARPRPPSRPSVRGDASSGMPARTSLVGVVAFALRQPAIRDTTILFALANIGEGILLVVLAERSTELGLGTGGYGYLVAAMTAGELLAAVLLARLRWPHPLVPSILVAQLCAAAAAAALLVPLPVTTLAAMFALGLLGAPMTAWAQSLRMRLAPEHLHGRLFAVLRTTMQATPAVGAAIAAGLGTRGMPVAIAVVVAVMALPVPLAALDLLRQRLPPP